MNLTLIASVNNKFNFENPINLDYFNKHLAQKTIVTDLKTLKKMQTLLKNQRVIVVTNSLEQLPSDVLVFDTIEKLIDKLNNVREEVFVIGNSELYNQLFPYSNKMYLIHTDDQIKIKHSFFEQLNGNWRDNLLFETDKFKIIEYRRSK